MLRGGQGSGVEILMDIHLQVQRVNLQGVTGGDGIFAWYIRVVIGVCCQKGAQPAARQGWESDAPVVVRSHDIIHQHLYIPPQMGEKF